MPARHLPHESDEQREKREAIAREKADEAPGEEPEGPKTRQGEFVTPRAGQQTSQPAGAGPPVGGAPPAP